VAVTAVTKCFCGDVRVCEALLDGGIETLGDSRLRNLKKYASLPVEKWLLRPPMPCETDELVRYADLSLHSEASVVRLVDRAAGAAGKRHKIILMAELGDLRDGIWSRSEFLAAADLVMSLPHVDLYGVGANLTCLSFVRADAEKMHELLEIRSEIEKRTGAPLRIVSGGNSATLKLLLSGDMPAGVNHLRLGESLLFGKERADYQFLKDTYRDAFILETQIIELKEKPSMPWGIIGENSYGKRPIFEDRGVRLRAICAVGSQDTDAATMRCTDSQAEIADVSSDHLVMDLTRCDRKYRVGDIVSFELGYYALLRACTSEYVEKQYRTV
jgi:predicted amino acid racemase